MHDLPIQHGGSRHLRSHPESRPDPVLLRRTELPPLSRPAEDTFPSAGTTRSLPCMLLTAFPFKRTWWPLLVLASALPTFGQGGASLTVHVVLNKPDAGGILRVALCPDKAAYDSEQGCTVLALEAIGHVVTGTFADVHPGTCAVKVFHDINRDGELNTSWIGWPQEPYGFSNDAPVNMGPPAFKLAMITVKEGENPIRIALR